LARLFPYLTPELAAYLDYLRKIGDIMVNYTTASVFLLDHEHRFEVLEENKLDNAIDLTLSLNILKKRDTSITAGSNTVSRVSSNAASSSTSTQGQRIARKTTVICWQFNQPNGCAYTPNCRFVHSCNIVGCGQDHPAYKHVFRASTTATAPSGSTDAKAR
jgi:hypothetical protein